MRKSDLAKIVLRCQKCFVAKQFRMPYPGMRTFRQLMHYDPKGLLGLISDFNAINPLEVNQQAIDVFDWALRDLREQTSRTALVRAELMNHGVVAAIGLILDFEFETSRPG
jgi:hypothetical protein